MAFPPQFLDEIRDRVSLAGVVGHHVKLTRRGREYVGLCPFHSEKTPSFTVVEDKAFYHCFGCGAHGDVIGFTMRMSSMGFREAIENLAREAGLKIPEELPEDRERHERSLSLHDACEQACVFFEEQLRAPGGGAARDYLARRGLDAETIARFRLGWAPEARDALKRALGGRFPEPLLVEAGLLRRAEDRDSYDFFRGRVIFPIADKGGKIIAFGGRTMGDGQPKYLNSPDTPIFDKGRTLYGAHLARAAKTEFLPIVTEGYMDVISLHLAGFPGAVAPLGTALTETQLLELWRLGEQPILCFDGDAAGKRAAVRALARGLPLLRPEVGLRFVLLPETEDPDSLIKSQGAAVFRGYLEGAIDASEFTWRVSAQGREASYYSTPEKILGLQSRIGTRIRTIENGAVQREFQHYLNDRLWDIRRQTRRSRELEKLRPTSQALRVSGSAGWADTDATAASRNPARGDRAQSPRRGPCRRRFTGVARSAQRRAQRALAVRHRSGGQAGGFVGRRTAHAARSSADRHRRPAVRVRNPAGKILRPFCRGTRMGRAGLEGHLGEIPPPHPGGRARGCRGAVGRGRERAALGKSLGLSRGDREAQDRERFRPGTVGRSRRGSEFRLTSR